LAVSDGEHVELGLEYMKGICVFTSTYFREIKVLHDKYLKDFHFCLFERERS